MATKICPICGEGTLKSLKFYRRVDFNGEVYRIENLHSVCDTCGSEQADASQLKQNKRNMIAAKKKANGYLTGAEIRSLRAELKITQDIAAEMFGGGPVSFSKYENDDVFQSSSMDRILRLSVEVPGVFEYLARKAGLEEQLVGKWETVSAHTVGKKIKTTKVVDIYNYGNSPRYAA
ncbi:Transcriptional regulator XRE family protein [Salinisphaera shabanensis E1L3A]|uniref:Transcriptional regulator XRE family protein n=1 Tax=Salinisphaera shabanensis E1L3A TaxID=1033802 RepID=U2ER96_9GAMM|nr:type II toxin-antitoxin system MqsA family antitoxin [Salinisphaera shabanensis]ERJ20280.1 Transcriptional regulator XRE family protein [Salinisphaera shabanensis E1L3A]